MFRKKYKENNKEKKNEKKAVTQTGFQSSHNIGATMYIAAEILRSWVESTRKDREELNQLIGGLENAKRALDVADLRQTSTAIRNTRGLFVQSLETIEKRIAELRSKSQQFHIQLPGTRTALTFDPVTQIMSFHDMSQGSAINSENFPHVAMAIFSCMTNSCDKQDIFKVLPELRLDQTQHGLFGMSIEGTENICVLNEMLKAALKKYKGKNIEITKGCADTLDVVNSSNARGYGSK